MINFEMMIIIREEINWECCHPVEQLLIINWIERWHWWWWWWWWCVNVLLVQLILSDRFNRNASACQRSTLNANATHVRLIEKYQNQPRRARIISWTLTLSLSLTHTKTFTLFYAPIEENILARQLVRKVPSGNLHTSWNDIGACRIL